MKRENDKQLTPSRPRRLIGSAPSAFFEAGDAVLAPQGVILHPTDYSESSRQAFEFACRLARPGGAD